MSRSDNNKVKKIILLCLDIGIKIPDEIISLYARLNRGKKYDK